MKTNNPFATMAKTGRTKIVPRSSGQDTGQGTGGLQGTNPAIGGKGLNIGQQGSGGFQPTKPAGLRPMYDGGSPGETDGDQSGVGAGHGGGGGGQGPGDDALPGLPDFNDDIFDPTLDFAKGFFNAPWSEFPSVTGPYGGGVGGVGADNQAGRTRPFTEWEKNEFREGFYGKWDKLLENGVIDGDYEPGYGNVNIPGAALELFEEWKRDRGLIKEEEEPPDHEVGKPKNPEPPEGGYPDPTAKPKPTLPVPEGGKEGTAPDLSGNEVLGDLEAQLRNNRYGPNMMTMNQAINSGLFGKPIDTTTTAGMMPLAQWLMMNRG